MTNHCLTGFSSGLDKSPRPPVSMVEGEVAFKLSEGVLNNRGAMQCSSKTSRLLGVKKVANKIVKHIVTLIWPTVYLAIAYRVNSLNGQQESLAEPICLTWSDDGGGW